MESPREAKGHLERFQFPLFAVSVLLFFSSLSLPGINPPVPLLAAEMKGDWKAEWDKLVQEAGKEGKLTVYVGDYEELVREFERTYPQVKTSVVVDPRQLSSRILAERRADKYLADILMVGPTASITTLARSLDPLKPVLIHPEVLDESKWFAGKHWWADEQGQYTFVFQGNVASAFGINTHLIKPGEVKSYWDFLNARWKGKVMVRDIRQPGPGAGSARMLYHHPEIGAKYLYRLFSEMDAYISGDARTMGDLLAKGRYAIFFFTGGAGIKDMETIGLPVTDRIEGLKEGGFLSANWGTLALMNRAPHPRAARLFVNWALSRRGQTTFQNVISMPRNAVNSLRMDIPKDHLPIYERLKPGEKYFASFQDAPVQKIAQEALRASGRI
jgi:iron(III) transport system substrate-binding protein